MVWGGGAVRLQAERPRLARRGGVGTHDCMDMERMVGTLGHCKLMIFFNFIFRAKPGESACME